jgi:1-deoxy-D-xylulose-5-phosphate reductoisomerase
MPKIGILGSTGSIGCSAISLIKNELKGRLEVEFLSFHYNAELALKQAFEVGAKKIISTSKQGFADLQKLHNNDAKIEIYYGNEALKEECKNPEVEVILLAIVGVSALEFALEAILQNSKRILAIANKEAIICGNHLIQNKIKNSNTKLIPVDSEHNSLLRLLSNTKLEDVESAFITASGGPFFGKKYTDLTNIEVKDVVAHPVWNMGAKISVDSATMANKGLELIEAYKLFGFKSGKIEAFVCKGSLLHAGITTKDGASIWFLSKPDMKNHISNAILGDNIAELSLERISPLSVKNLSFEEIKQEEFPIFFIAKAVAESENLVNCISFNILNEIAVSKFLKGQIKYTQILDIIEGNLGYNPSNLSFLSFDEIANYFQELKALLAN